MADSLVWHGTDICYIDTIMGRSYARYATQWGTPQEMFLDSIFHALGYYNILSV